MREYWIATKILRFSRNDTERLKLYVFRHSERSEESVKC